MKTILVVVKKEIVCGEEGQVKVPAGTVVKVDVDTDIAYWNLFHFLLYKNEYNAVN